jgi:hypothetical protein
MREEYADQRAGSKTGREILEQDILLAAVARLKSLPATSY